MNGEPTQAATTVAPGMLPVNPPSGCAHDQEVASCTGALLSGDFRQARRSARWLLSASPLDEAERAFAEQVLRRTGMDGLALLLVVVNFFAFCLIVFLTLRS